MNQGIGIKTICALQQVQGEDINDLKTRVKSIESDFHVRLTKVETDDINLLERVLKIEECDKDLQARLVKVENDLGFLINN